MLAKKKKKYVKINCLITLQPSFALLSEWSPLSHCLYVRLCHAMTKANKFLWLFFSVNTLVELPIKMNRKETAEVQHFPRAILVTYVFKIFSLLRFTVSFWRDKALSIHFLSLSSFHHVIQPEYVFMDNSSRQALFHLLSPVPT